MIQRRNSTPLPRSMPTFTAILDDVDWGPVRRDRIKSHRLLTGTKNFDGEGNEISADATFLHLCAYCFASLFSHQDDSNARTCGSVPNGYNC